MIFTGIGEKGRLIDHLFCSVGKYVFTEECFYHLFTEQYMQLPFTGYIVIKHTPLQFYRLPVFSPNQIPEEKEYPFYSLFFFLPNRKLKKKNQAHLIEQRVVFKLKLTERPSVLDYQSLFPKVMQKGIISVPNFSGADLVIIPPPSTLPPPLLQCPLHILPQSQTTTLISHLLLFFSLYQGWWGFPSHHLPSLCQPR